jgi:hypothetical protein
MRRKRSWKRRSERRWKVASACPYCSPSGRPKERVAGSEEVFGFETNSSAVLKLETSTHSLLRNEKGPPALRMKAEQTKAR